MGWFDDILRNLTEAADPVKNLKALVGIMPEESMVAPDGTPVNIGMPTGGGRALGQAGRALVPAGRAVAPRAGRRAAGSIDDGMFAEVIETLTSARPSRGLPGKSTLPGGGRPAVGRTPSRYSPRGSSNTTVQLADDAARSNKTKAAMAALVGAAGAGGLRNAMGGGRQEGSGAQGQVVDVPESTAPARGMRSLTPEEEARTLGAPGSGGLDDPRLSSPQGGLGDPGSELADLTNQQFDRYGEMIDEMSGTYANLAESNMGQIADIFGEVSGVAQGGVAPLADTYAQGQQNVGGIYDNLDDRLGDVAGNLQGIANEAAGSAAGDVASTAGASIAPFEAASATARANAQANMAQHSNAGQNYLSNLASASGEEGKMHASRVQAAAQQRQAEFDIRRMELEMAREEALREVAMDTAGSAAEREAMAALFGAAGIPLPDGMDMKGAQSYLNIGQDLGLFDTEASEDAAEYDQLVGQLSGTGQGILDTVIRNTEHDWTGPDPMGGGGDRLQDFMFNALAELDEQIKARSELGGEVFPTWDNIDEEERIIREIIRNEYSRF